MVDEEQLRETLHRRAETVEPSANGWSVITRRIERRQRRTRTVTLSLVGGFSFAAVVVAVALVTHAIPDTDQNVAASGGSAPAFRPTTTVAQPFATPTTVAPFDALPGQATPGGPDDAVPPVGAHHPRRRGRHRPAPRPGCWRPASRRAPSTRRRRPSWNAPRPRSTRVTSRGGSTRRWWPRPTSPTGA